jgi:succinate-semialdehyde dehydrogenase/glutarate-semialdehyde dehydrogenase
MLESRNPATGALVVNCKEHDGREVATRLTAATAAFRAWRELGFPARAELLRAAARQLRAQRDPYARLVTEEMGKPIGQAESEIEKCAWGCEYYAEHGERFLASEVIATDAGRSLVRYEPLGPVLAVMPWNFPFWQVIRFAAPALMAGNVGILKHASNVPRCALALEELFRTAGFPAGVFASLMISARATESVIQNPGIAAVTLTGSEGAGKAVAATAGQALKKVVLELGGSDPFLVLADADLEAAATTAVEARMVNNGQSCIAAKRFIAVEQVAEEFETRFAEKIAALKVGDPMDRATQVGPLARADLVRDLDQQVKASVAAGAKAVVGGGPLPGKGNYFAPTLLTGVRPGMPVFDQETFGPVAALTRARDEAEAIALANRSSFGLGASLWTRDVARGEALAGQIEAGLVFVNGMVKSDPRLPFGGVKRSGHGRELGALGIREFVNAKTVWIA